MGTPQRDFVYQNKTTKKKVTENYAIKNPDKVEMKTINNKEYDKKYLKK